MRHFAERALLSSITAATWENTDEIPPHRLGLFYVAKKSSEDPSGTENWDTIAVDAEEVESFVKSYFDISSEYLRGSEYYDTVRSSYTFESLGTPITANVIRLRLLGVLQQVYRVAPAFYYLKISEL